jgi:hypothetical protein
VAKKRLLECSFLIPFRRDALLSDGKPHLRSAWRWLEDSLLPFEGGSRDTAPTEGWYPDPDTGARVWDRSRRYVVAIARKRVDELRAVLAEACRVFRQKSIYLSVAGHVEFVEGPSDES